MKAKMTPSNIKGFLQGNIRKILDSVNYLPEHIKEQWIFRIGMMDESCLINKQCPCECKVPEKQLEDRPCENNCYTKMLSKEDWIVFKSQIDLSKIIQVAEERIEKYNLNI